MLPVAAANKVADRAAAVPLEVLKGYIVRAPERVAGSSLLGGVTNNLNQYLGRELPGRGLTAPAFYASRWELQGSHTPRMAYAPWDGPSNA
jgi:hypothetical protein